MKLYHMPGSCSLASLIALEEAGARFEVVLVDLLTQEQRSPEYLALNIKGRVPALLTDKGLLTENIAILTYVAQTFPEAQLAPTDPWEFAQAQSFNSYLASTVHVAHAHGARGYRWADDEASLADMRRKLPQTMGECFRLIDQHLLTGPWVLGDNYSACDGYLFAISEWMERDGLERSQYPNVQAHRERMLQRPAVLRALGKREL